VGTWHPKIPKFHQKIHLPKMAKSRTFLRANANQVSRASIMTVKGNFRVSLSLVSALALVLVPLVRAENSARTSTVKSTVQSGWFILIVSRSILTFVGPDLQDGLDMKLNNLAKQLQSENARMLAVKNEVHSAARKVAELSGRKASTFALSGVEEVFYIMLHIFSNLCAKGASTGQGAENESCTSRSGNNQGLSVLIFSCL
jgi:hypothetical protein